MVVHRMLREKRMDCRGTCFGGKDGAEGGTRTPMGCPTRPSNVRVYQFHHFGTCDNLLATEITLHTEKDTFRILFFSVTSVANILFLYGRLLGMDGREPV